MNIALPIFHIPLGLAFSVAILTATPFTALAGNYSCAQGARLYLEKGRERCSDGSIPIYRQDAPSPASAPTAPPVHETSVKPLPQEPALPDLPPPAKRVESLRCDKPLRCADQPGPQGNASKVLVEGRFPGQEGAAIRAELTRTNTGQVVDRGEGQLAREGFLGFRLPVSNLPAGDYRFRVEAVKDGITLGAAAFSLVEVAPAKPPASRCWDAPAAQPTSGAVEAMAQGVRLSCLDCRGVSCQSAEGMQSGLTMLNLSGGDFSAYNGFGLRITTTDAQGRVADERNSGVINGRIEAGIPAYRLAKGSYQFQVKPRTTEQVLASGYFTVAAATTEARTKTPTPVNKPTPQSAPLAGAWRGFNGTAGVLVLRPDGVYTFQGQSMGSWKPAGNGVDFTGQPFAFMGNHAQLYTDGPILAFRKDLMELFFKKVD